MDSIAKIKRWRRVKENVPILNIVELPINHTNDKIIAYYSFEVIVVQMFLSVWRMI